MKHIEKCLKEAKQNNNLETLFCEECLEYEKYRRKLLGNLRNECLFFKKLERDGISKNDADAAIITYPLIEAINTGYDDIVKFFIDIVRCDINKHGRSKRTPLFLLVL